MDCDRFTRLATLRDMQAPSIADKLQMLLHRVRCVYCRRFIGQVKKITMLLKAEGKPIPMPETMRRSIQENLEKHSR